MPQQRAWLLVLGEGDRPAAAVRTEWFRGKALLGHRRRV